MLNVNKLLAKWLVEAKAQVKRDHRRRNRQIKAAVEKIMGRKVRIVRRDDYEVHLTLLG